MEEASRRRLPLEVQVAVLAAAASLPLGRVFRPGAWPAVWLGVLTSFLLLALVCRRLPFPLSFLLGLGGTLWLLIGILFPSTLAGPFPTPSSARALASALPRALRAARTSIAPADPMPDLLLLAGGCTALAAWAAWELARARAPLLAAGLLLPVLSFPGAVTPPDPGAETAQALAFGAASLLLLHGQAEAEEAVKGREGRARRGRSAFLIGAAALALGALVAPALPGYGSEGIRLKELLGGDLTLSPLVSVKPSLTMARPRQVLLLRTDAPVYLRLTSLDTFDGTAWVRQEERGGREISGRTLEPEADPASPRVRQSVRILGLGGKWLPAAYDPVRVEGLQGVRLEPGTRSLLLPGSLSRGLEYTVISAVPRASPAELDAAFEHAPPSDLGRYLGLPPGPGTEAVREIAEAVAGSQPTPYRKALAIQDFLRTFTYDEAVAAGHSYSDLLTFLTRAKRGYCEQFAAAMAVMLRTLGIPARVAVGFAVGREVSPGTYIVTTRQAHAWPEVYFPGKGWLPFEPTPRSDSVILPDYASALPQAPAPPETGPFPETLPTPDSPRVRGPRLPEEREGPAPLPRQSRLPRLLLAGAAIGLLAAASLARPGRLLRRRFRRSPEEVPLLLYLDFLDWCAAVGFSRKPGETPLEHARRLASLAPSLTPAALAASRALWAQEGGGRQEAPRDLADALASARIQLARAVPTWRRLLIRLGWLSWRRDPAWLFLRPPRGTLEGDRVHPAGPVRARPAAGYPD